MENIQEKRKVCSTCNKNHGSVNWAMWKCPNCNTTFCGSCRKGVSLCPVCKKGHTVKVR